jgi:LysM repeat protein
MSVTTTRRRRWRWPWILLGGSIAMAPLSCTGGDDPVGVDLPDTTPFRTTLVEVITTTTTAPTTSAAPSGTAAPGSTAPSGPGGTYSVVAGDYWIGIANKVGVTLEALLAANNATPESFLAPGQQIRVPPGGTVAPATTAPAPASSTPTGATGRTYTVVEGDYWIGIAQKLNVALDALLAANGATTESFLAPGQTLNVP